MLTMFVQGCGIMSGIMRYPVKLDENFRPINLTNPVVISRRKEKSTSLRYFTEFSKQNIVARRRLNGSDI